MVIPLGVITNLDFCNNFSIFAIANGHAMTTKLIRIGNSRGIVIPSKLLKKYGVDDNATVSIEEEGGRLFLHFSKEEEPFTGPFTGPFKALAAFKDMEDPWGGEDASEYIRHLRDETGVEKRELPEW